MPKIENLHLELSEQAGFAILNLSYQVRGTEQDVLNHRHFQESVVLVGDDNRPGEDGVDDVLTELIAFEVPTAFKDTKPISRSEKVILPSSVLDEDRRSPFGGPQKEDELRFRVTLLNNAGGRFREHSNIVRRGAPAKKSSVLSSAPDG